MTTEVVETVPLKDGEYECYWGGYEVSIVGCLVRISINKGPWHPRRPFTLRFQTMGGIRTPQAAAILTVKDGKGTVRTV